MNGHDLSERIASSYLLFLRIVPAGFRVRFVARESQWS